MTLKLLHNIPYHYDSIVRGITFLLRIIYTSIASIDARKRAIGLYRRDLYTDTVPSIQVWRQKSRVNFLVNGYPTCVDMSSATFHRTKFALDQDAWN